MKLKFTILVFALTTMCFAQKDLKQHEKDNYLISYSEGWRLDTSGKMNTEFILFSELKDNDLFSENINMVIQDLTNQGFTMKSYVKLTENQIRNMVPDGKVIESVFNKEKNFHTMVWSGNVTGEILKFKQYYFFKNEKIYMLTLTTLPTTYNDYLEEGNKILNSFKLK